MSPKFSLFSPQHYPGMHHHSHNVRADKEVGGHHHPGSTSSANLPSFRAHLPLPMEKEAYREAPGMLTWTTQLHLEWNQIHHCKPSVDLPCGQIGNICVAHLVSCKTFALFHSSCFPFSLSNWPEYSHPPIVFSTQTTLTQRLSHSSRWCNSIAFGCFLESPHPRLPACNQLNYLLIMISFDLLWVKDTVLSLFIIGWAEPPRNNL